MFREKWAKLRKSARDGVTFWEQQHGSHSQPFTGLKAEGWEAAVAISRED